MRRALRIPLLVVGATFLVIQVVPYGWERPNPPVVQDAPWPSSAAEGLARSSCYDCHSNEVDWPLQAYAAEAVLAGSMPPRRYTLLHPGAALSAAEKEDLVAALGAMDD